MALTCIIPIGEKDRANSALESAGFGPECFNIELGPAGLAATHIGFHSWREELLEAVQKLGIASMYSEKRGGLVQKFDEIKAARGFETKARLTIREN